MHRVTALDFRCEMPRRCRGTGVVLSVLFFSLPRRCLQEYQERKLDDSGCRMIAWRSNSGARWNRENVVVRRSLQLGSDQYQGEGGVKMAMPTSKVVCMSTNRCACSFVVRCGRGSASRFSINRWTKGRENSSSSRLQSQGQFHARRSASRLTLLVRLDR